MFIIVKLSVSFRDSLLAKKANQAQFGRFGCAISKRQLDLKVSKNRKQIFQPKLLPKTEPSNFFSILISSQDRKTNSLVCYLEEVLAGKFAFEIY